MRTILLISFFTLPYHVFCQNLVPNPSFEDYDWCPVQQNDPISASHWYIPSSSGTSGGTSDYFNECSSIVSPLCLSLSADAPQNCVGFQYARTGEGYGGFLTYVPVMAPVNYKEYLGVKLVSKLTAGATYCVSFYVSLGDSCNYSVAEIGAFVSHDSLIQLSAEPTSTLPVVVNSAGLISDKTAWTEISGEFVATGTEQFLFIGSYNDYANTTIDSLTNGGSHGNHILSYYYLDDVSLECCSELCFEANVPNVFSPNGDGVNDDLVTSLPPGGKLRIYNRWGQLLFESSGRNDYWDGTTTAGEKVPDGVYYYVIEVDGASEQRDDFSGSVSLIR